MAENNGWHLDKRVPIALVIMIVLQTVGATWYASRLASQVEINREEISRLRQQSTPERLARIEEKLNAIILRLDRYEDRRRPSGSYNVNPDGGYGGGR